MAKIIIPQRRTIQYDASRALRRSKRSKAVIAVLILIAIGSLVLLALPYLPRIRFLFFHKSISASPYQQAAQQTKSGQKAAPIATKQPGNRLVLPKIGVDTQIIEGKNIYVIGKNQGVWRETSKIDPTTPGNIVIAGHRFLYTATNGGWFYNLPELKIGDKIYITWNEKVYEYEVYNTRAVYPTQTDIRDPDPEVTKKLTMYTCYPLGSTAKRFVIEAKQL